MQATSFCFASSYLRLTVAFASPIFSRPSTISAPMCCLRAMMRSATSRGLT